MRSYHPDLEAWILEQGYGRALSRPGLPLRVRELLAVAMLAALGLERQLPWHAAGALRVGASRAELAAVLEAAAQRRSSRRTRPRRSR
jgi:4-carboxymuconolactone decarboxylase